MTLSPKMRDALTAARRGPLRRTHTPGEGKPAWPAHPSTLAALVRHGLLDRSEGRNRHGYRLDLWTITDAGRAELEPRHRFIEQRPRWMARTGSGADYTSIRGESIDDTEAEYSGKWDEIAERRRLEALDRRELARRAARLVRRAA